jgi:DNA-binding response OmpR family regulator
MEIACYVRTDEVANQVQAALTESGFECERFESETLLLRSLQKRKFDLIVADAESDQPSEEFLFTWLNCRTGEATPVVLLSDGRDSNRIAAALNAGADDYIARPFHSAELVARLNAVMRRYGKLRVRRRIELAGFTLDRETCKMTDHGTPIELTPREFIMAWLLFSSPGTYVSRVAISTAIWGVGSDIANRTIEQHVYKLRKKIRLGAERGVTIQTAYSQGYRLELAAQGEAVA